MANDEHQLNIELCSAVEKHPCLYDISSEDHSRRRIMEQAWADVGEQVNFTAEACKKRWANLRTVYVRTAKMQKRGLHPVKEYYLSRHMHFLRPHIKPLLCPSPVTVSANEHSEQKPKFKSVDQGTSSADGSRQHVANNSGLTAGDEIDSMTERSVVDDADEFQMNDESTMNHHNNRPNIIYPGGRRHRKKTAANKRASVIDEALLDYFRFKKQKLASGDPENPRRYFLLSLLPEVDAMPEEQFKVFKRRVLTLIDELEVPLVSDSSL